MLEQSLLAAAERRVALLRIAAVGLIYAGSTVGSQHLHPDQGDQAAFRIVAAVVLVYAIVALVWAYQGTVTRRLSLAATALDVIAISVLALLSGGAYSEARFAYLLIPISVSFRFNWKITVFASLAVVVAYDIQAATQRLHTGDVGFLLVETGYLIWIGAAATLFSGLLNRRTRDLVQLASGRRQLLADVMSAEDRERRILAENLHDHAIQSVLVARQDIEDAVTTGAQPDLERARDALSDVVTDLRGAIFELHPHVLDQAGLETALRAVAERAGRRGGLDIDLYLNYPRRHTDETLLLSAAREFLANAAQHAHASKVTVTLTEAHGAITMSIQDNGTGFDIETLSNGVAKGHIGLLSQRERIEATGGRLDIVSVRSRGTTITITLPTS